MISKYYSSWHLFFAGHHSCVLLVIEKLRRTFYAGECYEPVNVRYLIGRLVRDDFLQKRTSKHGEWGWS